MIELSREIKGTRYSFPDDFLNFAVKVISSICSLTKRLEALRKLLIGNALGLETVRKSIENERQELDYEWREQIRFAIEAGGLERFLEDFTKRDAVVREKEILLKALFERFALDAHKWKIIKK